MKPYYYIYRPGGSGPTIKHGTIIEAGLEAERLAGENPGQVFEILLCLGCSRTVKADTTWADGVDPDDFV